METHSAHKAVLQGAAESETTRRPHDSHEHSRHHHAHDDAAPRRLFQCFEKAIADAAILEDVGFEVDPRPGVSNRLQHGRKRLAVPQHRIGVTRLDGRPG